MQMVMQRWVSKPYLVGGGPCWASRKSAPASCVKVALLSSCDTYSSLLNPSPHVAEGNQKQILVSVWETNKIMNTLSSGPQLTLATQAKHTHTHTHVHIFTVIAEELDQHKIKYLCQKCKKKNYNMKELGNSTTARKSGLSFRRTKNYFWCIFLQSSINLYILRGIQMVLSLTW